METIRLRFFRRASLGVLALAVASCGGGSSSTPTITPTPTPAPTPLPPVVVAQRTGVDLAAGFIAWLSFPTSRAGQLDTTVDWTSAETDIDVYLVLGECNYDQLAAGQCQMVAVANSTTDKPETFTYESTSASTYTIFIDNLGPGDESVSFQVVLRATLGGSVGASSTDAAATPVATLPRRARGLIDLSQ